MPVDVTPHSAPVQIPTHDTFCAYPNARPTQSSTSDPHIPPPSASITIDPTTEVTSIPPPYVTSEILDVPGSHTPMERLLRMGLDRQPKRMTLFVGVETSPDGASRGGEFAEFQF
jgi:hypothetical protein